MIEISSIIDGSRQSACPAKVSVAQYAEALAHVYFVGATFCCHISLVTLSVTVPSPLSV